MKICHVINDLSRGGAESHLYSLVKLQIEKGHDVSVLLLGKDLHNFVSLENEFTSLNLNLNRFKGTKDYKHWPHLHKVIWTARPLRLKPVTARKIHGFNNHTMLY